MLCYYFSHYCDLVEAAKSGQAHFGSQFEGMQSPQWGDMTVDMWGYILHQEARRQRLGLVSFLLFSPSVHEMMLPGWKVEIPSQKSTEAYPRKAIT